MNNDHKRQHYIPQFIIKNFCNSIGKTYYYNKINDNIEQKWPREIFEENYLYRYSFENQDNPNIIEKDLAEFERIASEIIRPFKENYSVSLDYNKNELLKYFFFIMMLRSKFMTAKYNKEILEHNKKKSPNISIEELDEFYKKNLGRFVKYRSLYEAAEDKNINQQFLRYAISIIFGNGDKHFLLLQSGDNTEFILGDAYPIGLGRSINFLDVFGRMALKCFIFPISPKRAIALTDTYTEFHDRIKQFKIPHEDWYNEPKKFGQGNLIEVKYLTDIDTNEINKGILDGSIDGVCFRNKNAIML